MLMHHVNAALKAHAMFHRDIDYIVKDNQVVIVDEHTGRTMQGRRWSEGLHQAIEAKEGVAIQHENQTLASITFQNYFRIYNKSHRSNTEVRFVYKRSFTLSQNAKVK